LIKFKAPRLDLLADRFSGLGAHFFGPGLVKNLTYFKKMVPVGRFRRGAFQGAVNRRLETKRMWNIFCRDRLDPF
jgi:hypothetical protein